MFQSRFSIGLVNKTNYGGNGSLSLEPLSPKLSTQEIQIRYFDPGHELQLVHRRVAEARDAFCANVRVCVSATG